MWSQPWPQSLSLREKDLGSLTCELASSCRPNKNLPYSDPIVNPRTHPTDAAPLNENGNLASAFRNKGPSSFPRTENQKTGVLTAASGAGSSSPPTSPWRRQRPGGQRINPDRTVRPPHIWRGYLLYITQPKTEICLLPLPKFKTSKKRCILPNSRLLKLTQTAGPQTPTL